MLDRSAISVDLLNEMDYYNNMESWKKGMCQGYHLGGFIIV